MEDLHKLRDLISHLQGKRYFSEGSHKKRKTSARKRESPQTKTTLHYEETAPPITIEKGANLISQIHHQLTNLDQLAWQLIQCQQTDNDDYPLQHPLLKVDRPEQLRACNPADTSMASGMNVSSTSDENRQERLVSSELGFQEGKLLSKKKTFGKKFSAPGGRLTD